MPAVLLTFTRSPVIYNQLNGESPMNDSLPVPSARQLKAFRTWFWISQPTFAAQAGISPTTLVTFEKGPPVSPETRHMIALQCHKMGATFNRDGALVLPV
jgi:DNA-binding XRE family transcriptional regulator